MIYHTMIVQCLRVRAVMFGNKVNKKKEKSQRTMPTIGKPTAEREVGNITTA